jgi:prophage antirepressor-like protein
MSNQNIILFENRQVRRYYDSENEIWYFSIVDIVEALTESVNPTDYLKKLRKRDKELGTYIGTNCPQVEMLSNGKKRKTLAGNAEDIFRLIQSIPSPKAEPFKQWLQKLSDAVLAFSPTTEFDSCGAFHLGFGEHQKSKIKN